MDFKNLKDEENGINEPESQLDSTNSGELSSELEFFSWYDDGDNAFEVGEKPLFGTSTQMASVVLASTSYALSDYLNGPAFPVNQTKYVGITWCAGNLTVNLATAKITCDATAMGNEAQTDSMSMDVSLRAVSSTQQPTFTCVKPPKPLEQCEIEGHKYDSSGKPLENWTMGLMKVIKHNKGTDIYDLATDVTDADGYYCLNWDGETRILRGVSTYKSGPYTFTYSVYEKLITGWKNVSIEKGPNFSTLSVVPNGDIKKDGVYVSTQIGEQNGYIYANAAYHVDFYNQLLKDKSKDVKKGKNGHNDKNHNAHNDDYLSGQINTDDFYQVSEDKTFSRKVKNSLNRFLSMFGNNNHG